MNKTVYVPSYFQPIYKEVTVKVPTGNTKRYDSGSINNGTGRGGYGYGYGYSYTEGVLILAKEKGAY
ncbi:hypothetical protein A9M85_02110 [Salmonella enterica subsp. enterica serovar Tennessee]|nr:hypothetical protein [Salmonella enterica]EBW2669858.1 hypothetical protein [Salmonella enterica subsp. enterica serovar Tennessee]EBR6087289.1 hypothetical protein [Salmonella enterica]EBY2530320.1 hypothetical protein [Salmonella enterica subsp. enterica serovar Tennessee]EBY7359087.1 hypothetical protein [Salmonella enterica subsp. enterica serovar Tennessee]